MIHLQNSMLHPLPSRDKHSKVGQADFEVRTLQFIFPSQLLSSLIIERLSSLIIQSTDLLYSDPCYIQTSPIYPPTVRLPYIWTPPPIIGRSYIRTPPIVRPPPIVRLPLIIWNPPKVNSLQYSDHRHTFRNPSYTETPPPPAYFRRTNCTVNVSRS